MDKKSGNGKRTVKDLPLRKGQDVKGGTFNAFANFGIKGESQDDSYR